MYLELLENKVTQMNQFLEDSKNNLDKSVNFYKNLESQLEKDKELQDKKRNLVETLIRVVDAENNQPDTSVENTISMMN